MIEAIRSTINSLYIAVGISLHTGQPFMQGDSIFIANVSKLEMLANTIPNRGVREVLLAVVKAARKVYGEGTTKDFAHFLVLCRSVRYALADAVVINGELENV